MCGGRVNGRLKSEGHPLERGRHARPTRHWLKESRNARDRSCSELFLALLLCLLTWSGAAVPARGEETDVADLQAQFLTFCDLAAAELNKEITPFADRDNADPTTHHMPFFEDAHAVRALAVAYDMTGNRKYLDACQLWSDRMIDYQTKMIPQGAYYMNHSRAPGQKSGEWNVADSGCVGMGVLATAVRCERPYPKGPLSQLRRGVREAGDGRLRRRRRGNYQRAMVGLRRRVVVFNRHLRLARFSPL